MAHTYNNIYRFFASVLDSSSFALRMTGRLLIMTRSIAAVFLALVCLLLSSCRQEEMQQGGKGWLSVQSLSVNGVDVLKALDTRAMDEGLTVNILDTEGNVLQEYTQANAEELRKVVLNAGNYTLRAFSDNYDQTYTNSELGDAKYYAEQAFSIEEGKVCLVALSVPMTNFGITLILPDGFQTHFPSYGLTLTSGSRQVVIKEGEMAFFEVGEGKYTYQLAATNTDDEYFQTKVITYMPTEGGKLYKMTYYYGTGDNNGGFDIEIDDDMPDDDVDVPL